MMNRTFTYLSVVSFLGMPFVCHCAFPIQFSIPEEKIVQGIPSKDKDFATIIPGDLSTYVFEDEASYYKDYQRSYYAITKKKGGWDCLRHYEILANGCIPYFIDLESCPSDIMTFLPKELILEAMHLEGVSYLHIDHTIFNEKKYFAILEKLLEHTREYLTARKMAEYLLKTVRYEGKGKVLFLSGDLIPDYLRCLTLIGLKEILGERVIDVPKVEHIYRTYPLDVKKLSGKGFTYTRIIDNDPPIDREKILERIRLKEFELIIYGSIHRGMNYLDLVMLCYNPERVVYLCGEDSHCCIFYPLHNLFLREWE